MSYHEGTDFLGADADYGPPSPQQLMQANRPLTAAEQGLVNDWKKNTMSFLQREAFGGLKVWQAGALGIGALGILSGVLVAAFGRK